MLFLKLKNVDGLEFELNIHQIVSFALAPQNDTVDGDGRRSFISGGGTAYHLDHESTKKMQGVIRCNSILHDPSAQ